MKDSSGRVASNFQVRVDAARSVEGRLGDREGRRLTSDV
jgi:hypothetical protein